MTLRIITNVFFVLWAAMFAIFWKVGVVCFESATLAILIDVIGCIVYNGLMIGYDIKDIKKKL